MFPIPAALELRPGSSSTYLELLERLAFVLVSDHDAGTFWELLSTRLPDRPVARAVGFWARFGAELSVGTGADAFRVVDGSVIWVGARPLRQAQDAMAVWRDERRRRFRPQFMLLAPDQGAAELMTAVLDRPAGPGYAGAAWLAGFANARDGALVLFDETDGHEPCVVLSGARDRLEQLRLAIVA